MNQSYVFLDIDGVCNQTFCGKGQEFMQVHLLEACLARHARRVSIVISSSWRFSYELPALVSLFPKSMQSLIVDATGPAYVGKYSRWVEIQAYVKAHGVKRYRCLDDSKFEFPSPLPPELILCDSKTGVQPLQIQALDAWLMGKEP